MRVVLDTNVVVSGLLWEGAPRRLIDAAIDGKIGLYSSQVLMAELAGCLLRKKFFRRLTEQRLSVSALVERYGLLAELVTPAIISPAIAGDPDDDAVLACAVAATADLIVSGDSDLCNLKSYQRIPIVAAAEALMRIGAAGVSPEATPPE